MLYIYARNTLRKAVRDPISENFDKKKKKKKKLPDV